MPPPRQRGTPDADLQPEPTRSQGHGSRSRSRSPGMTEPQLPTARRSCRRGGSAVLTDVPVDSRCVLIDVAARGLLQRLTSREAQSVVCHALDQAAHSRDGIFMTQPVDRDGERISLTWHLRLLASRGCRVSVLEVLISPDAPYA